MNTILLIIITMIAMIIITVAIITITAEIILMEYWSKTYLLNDSNNIELDQNKDSG